jgi:hypothetical protein
MNTNVKNAKKNSSALWSGAQRILNAPIAVAEMWNALCPLVVSRAAANSLLLVVHPLAPRAGAALAAPAINHRVRKKRCTVSASDMMPIAWSTAVA